MTPKTAAIVVALAAALPAGASEVLPFAPGEQIDLTVKYLGVKMGSMRISVGSASGTVLPLFLQTRTEGLASIADVRQHIATYWDTETRLPRSSQLDALEMKYWHSDTTRFDRAAGKATVTVRRKSGVGEDVVDLPPDTLDFLSMVFVLRTRPLAVGGKHAFQILAGNKVTAVEVEVVAREEVDTGAGRIPAFKIRVPTTFTGQFSEKDPTFLWLSDDARRIPARISTGFVIGRAVASLTAYRPG
jgi:hypothetical protein